MLPGQTGPRPSLINSNSVKSKKKRRRSVNANEMSRRQTSDAANDAIKGVGVGGVDLIGAVDDRPAP